MSLYGYNFPWSGRIGRISDCCPYCGRSDSAWQLSSMHFCLDAKCRENVKNGAKPIPELKKINDEKTDNAVRAWCLENNIDYEKTVESFFNALGPQHQERDSPILGIEEGTDHLIIYLDPHGKKYIDEFALRIRITQENTRKILNNKSLMRRLKVLSWVGLDKWYAVYVLGWIYGGKEYILDSETNKTKETGDYFFWTGGWYDTPDGLNGSSYTIKGRDYKKGYIKDYRT